MKYFESSPSLTRWDCVEIAAPVVISSIVLPLVDIITDLRTIIRLFSSGYPIFAFLFLGYYFLNKAETNTNTFDNKGPFIANYIFSFINWYRFENCNKSLIWALFNLYPIYGKFLETFNSFI